MSKSSAARNTAGVQGARAAGPVGGYCWAEGHGGRGRCTRPPKHDGPHVDYYNGRKTDSSASGYTWT
ncbi:hypothetical protein JS756_29610 [Streptomyces actuosus]|uniref:Uncharacterized protein n=1 Tax=Streptomyces actuosus TaxID=1885 RepID=A0ABS2VYS6_STRAS|nr:hypothetical protein [Streptomyces actuosus]MBN0048194.1 hypothetical protein [Streptomyces actuosus]